MKEYKLAKIDRAISHYQGWITGTNRSDSNSPDIKYPYVWMCWTLGGYYPYHRDICEVKDSDTATRVVIELFPQLFTLPHAEESNSRWVEVEIDNVVYDLEYGTHNVIECYENRIKVLQHLRKLIENE